MTSLVKSTRPVLKTLTNVLSNNRDEARKRVLNLYKMWYRQIPYVVLDYDVPLTVERGRVRLRQEFDKNKNLTDIRAIDLLVIKGQMELVETAEIWKQRSHIMDYFRETVNKKPQDFLNKFFDGK